ncbi:MAG: tRNA pseudouridine(55) synthase TruB [Clostridiaceae bacterium]|nr:tRNA pseudouridine(55) synthase TruB [Clostridiaceae bacterium]
MLNGVIVFNKPPDFTSHDVVAKLRGILKTKKIGHAGTLDPMAEGVLVILVGAATKASDYLLSLDKTYRAGFKLGLLSDTLDIWGQTRETGAHIPDGESVRMAVESFEGGYMQVPPMYSAIQKDGVRLYDLARQGIEVERSGRTVDIKGIRLLSFDGQRGEIELTCSKGTYIRTLCHDIGQKLLCGAVMDSLVRLRSGRFDISEGVGFKELEALAAENRLSEAILTLEKVFSFLPALTLDEPGLKRALNGAYVDESMLLSGSIPKEEGTLCALYTSGGRLAVLARSGFLTVSGVPALLYEKTFYTGELQ